MTNIATRCPECKSAFQVESDQLNIAAGSVRCGVCLTIFKAADHIEKLASNELNVGYMPYVLDNHADLNAATENLQQEIDGLLGLDLDIDGQLDEVIRTDINEVLGLSEESNNGEYIDQWVSSETNFSNILDEPIERTEPSMPLSAINPFDDQPSTPTDKIRANKTKTNKNQSKKPWLAALAITLPIVFVGALLLIYLNSATLSQDPKYRGAMISLCQYTQCTINEYRDLDKLELSQLRVRSHPQQAYTISVSLSIENLAKFYQPFPKLRIRFTDLDNKLVAQHILQPQDYLSTKQRTKPTMSPRQINSIAIELVDPGTTATNYSVELVN